jgi:hypothetical protein
LLESLEERTVPQAGLTPNQAFVTQAYQVLLNRAPDSAGLTSWAAALDSGQLTRLQVATGLVNSQEFRTDEVQNLFQTLLKRSVGPGPVTAFTTMLAQGGTSDQIKAFILSSDEYFQTRGGGTNTGFLQAVYNDVLGRAPDPTGLQAFGTALANGVSRAQVVQVIVSSDEAIQDEVRQMYNQLLQRNPDPTGLAAFSTALGDPPASNGSAQNTTGSAQNTTGSAQNTSGSANASANASASAERTGALVALPTGTTVVAGMTVGTGAEAISIPNVTLPPGVVAVLLPGEMLPAGATMLSGITIPANAAEVTIPGVTLPMGTAAVPLKCSVLPDGTVVGVTKATTNGSNTSGSASGERTFAVVGATVMLPAGTTVISGATIPAGAEAISVPGVDLGPGEVVVLLPGMPKPAGATVLTDVTIPAGSVEVTTPAGVTLPMGTVAAPLQCAVLPDGTMIGPSTNGSTVRELTGSASAQRSTATMTHEDAAASIMASDEFFMRAQG